MRAYMMLMMALAVALRKGGDIGGILAVSGHYGHVDRWSHCSARTPNNNNMLMELERLDLLKSPSGPCNNVEDVKSGAAAYGNLTLLICYKGGLHQLIVSLSYQPVKTSSISPHGSRPRVL